jgi:hypothetical protein
LRKLKGNLENETRGRGKIAGVESAGRMEMMERRAGRNPLLMLLRLWCGLARDPRLSALVVREKVWGGAMTHRGWPKGGHAFTFPTSFLHKKLARVGPSTPLDRIR